MPEEYRNIYKTCRKTTIYTQEAAAERLGISVESIRAYENGQRIPPNHVVQLMAILYNAVYLGLQHLQETDDLYSSVVPEIQPRTVLEASVRLVNRIYHFADTHADRRLMRITEDNNVDDTEQAEYDKIQEDLMEIVEAALELRCAREIP